MLDQPEASGHIGDDLRYLDRAGVAAVGDAAFARMIAIINVLGDGLRLVPRLEWGRVGPNDVSAMACLARAYRQLRGSVHLLMFGYYGEVKVLLRATYECAALARMLAKDPHRADKWIRKQTWFPDREVRAWWASVQGDSKSEEMLSLYAQAYRVMSSWAHPTLMSCAPLVQPDDAEPQRPGLRLDTAFNEDAWASTIAEISGTALFSCFALRNSAVDEKAIDPAWRQRLYEIAKDISDKDMSHLERDWREEQEEYERLQDKINSVSEMDARLESDPLSWRNLNKSGGPT
jgi:hypothetical protein